MNGNIKESADQQSFLLRLLLPSEQIPCNRLQATARRNRQFTKELEPHGPWRNNTIYEESAKLQREEHQLELRAKKMALLGDTIAKDMEEIRCMQAAVRRRQKRVAAFLLQSASAIIIQSVFRAHLGRRVWRLRRKEQSCILLAQFWRKKNRRIFRQRATQLLKGAHRLFEDNKEKLRNCSAILIQKSFRGYVSRKALRKELFLTETAEALSAMYLKVGLQRYIDVCVTPQVSAQKIQSEWRKYKRRQEAKRRRLRQINSQIRKKGIIVDADRSDSPFARRSDNASRSSSKADLSKPSQPRRFRAQRPPERSSVEMDPSIIPSLHNAVKPAQQDFMTPKVTSHCTLDESGFSLSLSGRRRHLQAAVLESQPRSFAPTINKENTIWTKVQQQAAVLQTPITLAECVAELVEQKRATRRQSLCLQSQQQQQDDDVLSFLKGLKFQPTPVNSPGTGRGSLISKDASISRSTLPKGKVSIDPLKISVPESHSREPTPFCKEIMQKASYASHKHLQTPRSQGYADGSLSPRERLPQLSASYQFPDTKPKKRGGWSLTKKKDLFSFGDMHNGVLLHDRQHGPRPPSPVCESRKHCGSVEQWEKQGKRPSSGGRKLVSKRIVLDWQRVEKHLKTASERAEENASSSYLELRARTQVKIPRSGAESRTRSIQGSRSSRLSSTNRKEYYGI